MIKQHLDSIKPATVHQIGTMRPAKAVHGPEHQSIGSICVENRGLFGIALPFPDEGSMKA